VQPFSAAVTGWGGGFVTLVAAHGGVPCSGSSRQIRHAGCRISEV